MHPRTLSLQRVSHIADKPVFELNFNSFAAGEVSRSAGRTPRMLSMLYDMARLACWLLFIWGECLALSGDGVMVRDGEDSEAGGVIVKFVRSFESISLNEINQHTTTLCFVLQTRQMDRLSSRMHHGVIERIYVHNVDRHKILIGLVAVQANWFVAIIPSRNFQKQNSHPNCTIKQKVDGILQR